MTRSRPLDERASVPGVRPPSAAATPVDTVALDYTGTLGVRTLQRPRPARSAICATRPGHSPCRRCSMAT
jgi:hypothetical protein